MASLSPLTHFSNTPSSSYSKPHLIYKPFFSFKSKSPFFLLSADNGVGTSAAAQVEPPPPPETVTETPAPPSASRNLESSARPNGSIAAMAEEAKAVASFDFKDARWVNGTWDLKQFQKNGNTDWDAVIDAEARRRKWLEENPEASSNDNPVIFDTSIIPWWAWIKRFHLPEAERLNGRAAMIGFFMAYVVDSLTGLGLVDQTDNFLCKTLLLIAVVGVVVIRQNEDVENIKKLLEEVTFYDKQWQATWEDDDDNSKQFQNRLME